MTKQYQIPERLQITALAQVVRTAQRGYDRALRNLVDTTEIPVGTSRYAEPIAQLAQRARNSRVGYCRNMMNLRFGEIEKQLKGIQNAYDAALRARLGGTQW